MRHLSPWRVKRTNLEPAAIDELLSDPDNSFEMSTVLDAGRALALGAADSIAAPRARLKRGTAWSGSATGSALAVASLAP